MVGGNDAESTALAVLDGPHHLLARVHHDGPLLRRSCPDCTVETGGSGRGMRGGTSVSSTVTAGMAIHSWSE
jgi:hypothetical protein